MLVSLVSVFLVIRWWVDVWRTQHEAPTGGRIMLRPFDGQRPDLGRARTAERFGHALHTGPFEMSATSRRRCPVEAGRPGGTQVCVRSASGRLERRHDRSHGRRHPWPMSVSEHGWGCLLVATHPRRPGVYGYGKLFHMEDETILMSYVMSGLAPNRCYLVRLRVIGHRNGIELLPVGE